MPYGEQTLEFKIGRKGDGGVMGNTNAFGIGGTSMIAIGGNGGSSSGGGGGGSGYSSGAVTVISSTLGGSTGEARVIVRVV